MKEPKDAFVKYIVPNKHAEEDTLKRLQFYTFFPKEPNNFYFGLSFREFTSKGKITKWEKEGKLIKLTESVKIENKELWFDSKGNVICADGVNPIQDKQKRNLGRYKQLSKAYQLAQQIDLSNIPNYHIIPS
ncbi:MAG: hypothetical protein PF542_04425 [Nanoarchaeota archaeon]|jgi:hypothetical protein|nr:hypothetical protein [Nanoarchaeota archaeon]